MKKLYNILTLILTLVGMQFLGISRAYATGSASIGYDGPANATIGSEITVKLHVTNVSSDVPDGITTIGGNVVFDSSYLQYVSGEGVRDPFRTTINEASDYIIAGVPSGDFFRNKTTLFTLKFKALKEGTTTLGFKNGYLGDGNGDRVTANVVNKSITIGQPVPKSSDATLKSLGITGQTLTPAFSPNTTTYSVTIPAGTTAVVVTGATNDSKARATGIGNYTLKSDTLSIPITVKAEDGTTKTYTINVTREKAPDKPVEPTKSSDATLKDLVVEGYDITPVFSKDKDTYSLIVPNDANKVIINASKNDEKANVEIIGANNLKVGENTVTVKVTAEDGTVKTYTINVTKQDKVDEALDGDTTLKSLEVTNQQINPKFDKEITAYTIEVQNNINSLDVKAIANSTKAKVTISGNTNFKDGVNTINIKVTAENGQTKIYTINVIRATANKPTPIPNKSNDSLLKNLEIKSTHIMDKTFNPNETSYSVTVPYEIDKLDLSYITNNKNAKVTISGNEKFKVGEINTVILTVTAEDGSINYYVLNVTRNSKTSGTDLEKLNVDGKDIYEEGKTKYEVTTTKDKLDIEAILKDKDSKVEVIGNENFKEGHNTVLVKVTDKNGMIRYYEIDVVKNIPKTSGKFLGLSPLTWGILLGLLGFLVLLFLIIILFKRKKDDKQQQPIQPTPPTPSTPVIDFKPEFNFGSRNGTDDDVVYPGGVLNQGNGAIPTTEEPKKLLEADYQDLTDDDYEEITSNFNFYDETITKDELIAAIREGIKTKNSDKLRMLLKQDELNQLKKEIKNREIAKKQNRSDRYDRF